MTTADRKKQLIAQGCIYRAEILLAKEVMHQGLQPDSLAQNIIHQIAAAAFSLFKSKSVASANLSTLLPLALSGISAISKRKGLLRQILRGTLIAGTVASIAALISQKKKKSGSAG